jgi:hypothetical protein
MGFENYYTIYSRYIYIYIYIYIHIYIDQFYYFQQIFFKSFRRRPRSSRLLARTTPRIIASLPAMYGPRELETTCVNRSIDYDSRSVFFSWMVLRIVNYIYKVQENLIRENPRQISASQPLSNSKSWLEIPDHH